MLDDLRRFIEEGGGPSVLARTAQAIGIQGGRPWRDWPDSDITRLHAALILWRQDEKPEDRAFNDEIPF